MRNEGLLKVVLIGRMEGKRNGSLRKEIIPILAIRSISRLGMINDLIKGHVQ